MSIKSDCYTPSLTGHPAHSSVKPQPRWPAAMLMTGILKRLQYNKSIFDDFANDFGIEVVGFHAGVDHDFLCAYSARSRT